jgi:hypothetical protein
MRACIAFSMIGLLTASICLAGEPQTIQVTAKLVEIPSKFPPDDLYDYAYVMKYQVTEGSLANQIIYVAHYKPRRARDQIEDKMKPYVGGTLKRFKVGDVHQMTLNPKLDAVWTGAVEDRYFNADRNSIRYWCLKVDKRKK